MAELNVIIDCNVRFYVHWYIKVVTFLVKHVPTVAKWGVVTKIKK